MSLPLIREKVKRGAITENKQKDLTKSSSTLLVEKKKNRWIHIPLKFQDPEIR